GPPGLTGLVEGDRRAERSEKETSMPEAVIVDAVRTPIGRAVKGSLKDVRADDLASIPLKALKERNPDVDFGETVDVIMGAAFGAGEQGYNVGREAQDEWAVISQNRAVDARDSGHFAKEIVPVTTPDGTEVTQDDGPRPGTTMEKLAALQPAFKPDGTVTAGNACPLNDGAAAVLVMSDEKAERLGLKPRARIIASTVAAIRPEIMGLGPIPAIQKLLEITGKSIDDVDIVEINEAFAAQIVPCKED